MAQEMPPVGGFSPINVERTYAKLLFRKGWVAALLLGMTYHGCWYLRNKSLELRTLRAEIQEHYIAVEPFLEAERERKFLLHLWNLREDERDLMKDHKGWITGTLYGEKVFKTVPPGALPPVSTTEYFMHQNPKKISHSVNPDKYI